MATSKTRKLTSMTPMNMGPWLDKNVRELECRYAGRQHTLSQLDLWPFGSFLEGSDDGWGEWWRGITQEKASDHSDGGSGQGEWTEKTRRRLVNRHPRVLIDEFGCKLFIGTSGVGL
jgi:hypothetical protein